LSRGRAHKRGDLFAQAPVGHANDRTERDRRVAVEKCFDFAGSDFAAPAVDDLLQTAGDPEISVLLARREVSGMQPAVGVNGLAGCLGQVEVTAHHEIAAHQQLAGGTDWNLLSANRIADLVLDVSAGPADRLDRDGTRLTELAARADMTHQSMGELVDTLESRGYLTRRPDPADGRARLVCLSAKGTRMLRIAVREIGAIEDGWTQTLKSAGAAIYGWPLSAASST
jgi:hypothetical protein